MAVWRLGLGRPWCWNAASGCAGLQPLWVESGVVGVDASELGNHEVGDRGGRWEGRTVPHLHTTTDTGSRRGELSLGDEAGLAARSRKGR
jgi:hypothetical protein